MIAPSIDPTEWCSPGFFVPKSDGKSVRLVTDYTKLNSFVKRPVHHFHRFRTQSIPSTARIFAKFDAVNGVFQIALNKASSKLITFILPSGRYQDLRIPQGLNASSDECAHCSDVTIEGLPWARNNILIWAEDLQCLEDRFKTIAINCERLNMCYHAKNSKSAPACLLQVT